jgi:hypothetical protein
MTPDQAEDLSDEMFDAMVDHMEKEAIAIKQAQKPRR